MAIPARSASDASRASDQTPSREVRFERRVLVTISLICAAGLLLWGLWLARVALTIIYISALLAIGLAPAVTALERRLRWRARPIPRALAIGIVYLALTTIVAVLAVVVLPPLISQASDLQQKLPGMFRRAQQFLVERGFIARPVTIEQAVTGAATSTPTTVVAVASDAMARVAGGAVAFISVVFLTFYLLLEWPSISGRLWSVVPSERRPAVREMSRLIAARVSAWLGANAILGAIMGVIAAIGLGLLGVPYFYVVALIAAMGETVPVAGSIMAGIVAVGVASTESVRLAVIVGVFFFVVHEIEANVLVPRLMQRRLGVTSAGLIIALLVGWEWLGILGVILALPTTAVITAVVEAIGTPNHDTGSGIYPKSDSRYLS